MIRNADVCKTTIYAYCVGSVLYYTIICAIAVILIQQA